MLISGAHMQFCFCAIQVTFQYKNEFIREQNAGYGRT